MGAASLRGEDDAAAIGRPDRKPIIRWIKGEARGRAAREFQQPDILTRCLWIVACKRDSLAFGRKGRFEVIAWRSNQADLVAAAIKPGELGLSGITIVVGQHAILRDGHSRDVFSNREGLAREEKLLRIEGLGHQVRIAPKE